MKKIKGTAVVALAVLMFLTGTGFHLSTADEIPVKEKKSANVITEKAIKNFEQGIKSENEGLKKSAIYLAGVYKIQELAEPLLKQFAKENNESIKFLIALALYTIGDKEGLAAVKDWQNK